MNVKEKPWDDPRIRKAVRRAVNPQEYIQLLKFGDGVHWKLIETLAVDLAQMILEEFGPRSVTVEVKKFILPHARVPLRGRGCS